MRTLRQNAFALLLAPVIAFGAVAGVRAEDPLPLVKPKSDPMSTTAETPGAPVSGLPAASTPKPAGKPRGREAAPKPANPTPAVSTPVSSTLPPFASARPRNEIAEAQPPDPDAVPDPDPSPPPPQTSPVAPENARPPSQAHVFILIAALVALGVMTLRAGRG